MKDDVHLSVVIPVYNGGPFIRETIESVLLYSRGFNVECIVVDDGSTDDTSQIIESFGDSIRTIRQKNMGEGSAVNVGLQASIGSYVLVVSADDPVFTSNLFNGVTDFFEQNPEVVAWYPDWNVIDEEGTVVRVSRLPEYEFLELFSHNRVLPGPGTWFRGVSAKEIGGRNPKWKYVGDYDFWLRLSRKGILRHRSEVLAQWRRHPHSTSISDRGLGMARERIAVIDEFVEENLQGLDAKEITLARANARYMAARLGYFSIAVNSRKLLMEALKIDLGVLRSIKLYELLFMLTFPLSKKIMDFLFRFLR